MVTRGKGGVGVGMGKGVKLKVTEEDLTFSGQHTRQNTDDVSWNCALENSVIILSNAIPINLMKNKNKLKNKIKIPLNFST